MNVLFLDIDGVLNGHEIDFDSQCAGLRKDCVKRFNEILVKTGVKIVLSSAWRYMILGEAMTITGFEYMLRTHGVTKDLKIVGHTGPDQKEKTRGQIIEEWLIKTELPISKYLVVDDMDWGMEIHPFLRTDGMSGLTDEDRDYIINYFAETDANL